MLIEKDTTFVAVAWLTGIATVSLIVLLAYAIYSIAEDSKKWESFKVDHNCKIVEKVRGHLAIGTGVGMMPNGRTGAVITTVGTPGKTAWLCNDGVTYWR